MTGNGFDVIFFKFALTHLVTISIGFKPTAVAVPSPNIFVGLNAETFLIGLSNFNGCLKGLKINRLY